MRVKYAGTNKDAAEQVAQQLTARGTTATSLKQQPTTPAQSVNTNSKPRITNAATIAESEARVIRVTPSTTGLVGRMSSLPRLAPGSSRRAPSAFMYERRLTTQERLDHASLWQYTPQIIELVQSPDGPIKDCSVPLDRPIFEPFPSEVVLQSYKPFQTYEIVIKFRNMDKVFYII